MLADVEFCDGLTREQRLKFLHTITVLSVPMPQPEAFGMFILEALACAVPVIQPGIGAFPEIIKATGGGICYDPAQPAALTQALKSVLTDPTTARTLGQTGHDSVRRMFNIKVTAKQILAVYQQSIGAAGTG
jgi:glycosyltransferase involved in cell wall biosynthesis